MAIRYYVDPMVKNDKPTNEYDEIIFNSTDMSSTQNFVYTLNHQKVGTTHYLRGFPILKMTQNVDLFVGQFRATATFNENDKIIMIDSTDGTTEVNMIAEPIGADSQMPDEAFVKGDLVSVTIDGVNKKLGFKLGGSANDTLPPQIRSFAVTSGNAENKLSWLLPVDTTAYEGLLIVRKVGSAPTKISDGTKIELSKTAISYTDTGLTNDTTYYYRAFPYNSKKQYQTELTGAVVSGTPKSFSLPTYTGNHTIFGDVNEGRIEMYTSGTLTLSEANYDLFTVGAGGAGAGGFSFSGGGGGYTNTLTAQHLIGDYVTLIGSSTSDFGVQQGSTNIKNQTTGNYLINAMGGYGGQHSTLNSCGGSGGGFSDGGKGGDGGSDGSDGKEWEAFEGEGVGQHTTTRAFEEPDGTLYAGGGGGGGAVRYGATPAKGGAGGGGDGGYADSNQEVNPKSGTPNTGGGGGGHWTNRGGTKGGSGIAIIRWKNN